MEGKGERERETDRQADRQRERKEDGGHASPSLQAKIIVSMLTPVGELEVRSESTTVCVGSVLCPCQG